MTLLWLSALSLLFLAPSAGFLWLRRMQAPEWRLRHGKLLSSLYDMVRCIRCGGEWLAAHVDMRSTDDDGNHLWSECPVCCEREWRARDDGSRYWVGTRLVEERSSLPKDAACALCNARGVNTLVRNRGLDDMRVCQQCLRRSAPVGVAEVFDIRMPRTLRRLSLDEPDPPAKSMPRFDQ